MVKTIKSPAAKVCLLKMIPTCPCKTCSLLTDPCQFSACIKALKPEDSLCFQSFCHMLTRKNKIEKARGVVARVLCTSKTIKDSLKERPGGYKDFSCQEMELIMGAPLSAED